MTIRRVTNAEVRRMLARGAADFGYTVEQVQAMWGANTLAEPELRDLWLIWGDDLDGEQ